MPVVLPPAESSETHPEPPRMIVWLALLVIVMAGGAVYTLVTWPKNEPTLTAWFWIQLFGVPFLIWALAYGLRWLYHEQECGVDDHRGVSFVFSRLPTDDLISGMRERLDVLCEDRSEWQMKFFDTRSLALLDRALSAEQRLAYFGLAKQWWYLDRYGVLQKLISADETEDSYRGPLRLSDKQTAVFVDASLPDSVLHSLQLSDDDLLAEFDLQTRYRICEGTVAKATPRGVEQPCVAH